MEFTESFTERFTESRTESSLWDQGAWIREHGSGNNRREPVIHRLGRNARTLPTMDDASGVIGGGR